MKRLLVFCFVSFTSTTASLINWAGDEQDLYGKCVEYLGSEFCDKLPLFFDSSTPTFGDLVDLLDPILGDGGQQQEQETEQEEGQQQELPLGNNSNSTNPSLTNSSTALLPTAEPAPVPAPVPVSAPVHAALADALIRKAVNFYLEEPEDAEKVLGPIGSWNTSLVTDFSSLFYGVEDFNEDLSNWNTSSALSTTLMFFGATAFDQSLCWTINNDTDVTQMFCDSNGSFDPTCVSEDIIAASTDSCPTDAPTSAPTIKVTVPIDDDNIHEAVDLWLSDREAAVDMYGPLQNWDTANVTDMSGLFDGAQDFNHFIENWNVSGVVTMAYMFRGCTNFNRDLGNWDVSNVKSMSRMFDEASSFVGYGLEKWNVASLEDMSAMFHYATSFEGDVSKWNASSVKDMGYAFLGAAKFNSDLSDWTTSNVTSLPYMFHEATGFNGNIGNWNVSAAIDLEGMFYGAKEFSQQLCWNLADNSTTDVMFCDSGGSFDPSCVDAAHVQAALACDVDTSKSSRRHAALLGLAASILMAVVLF